MPITGAARAYVLLGDPLDKARSPEFYNTLLAARGIDAVLVPLEVKSAEFDATVRALKAARNVHGFIITMPHKQAICAHLDALGPTGEAVGAANVARREADGRWVGDMFDGPGYVGALRARGIEFEGKRAQFVGAGGVARAMAVALAEAGIGAIGVQDLDRARARSLVELLRRRYPKLACAESSIESEPCDIAINATPLGMRPDDALPFDPARLDARVVVSDVTTKPEFTPLLAAAQARGMRFSTGRDMFEAQTRLAEDYFGWSA